MSEPAPEQSRPRIYGFGTWSAQNDNAADVPTELGQRMLDWFAGKAVPFDDKLSRALFEEFVAHERFRVQLVQTIARCANQLKAAAGSAVDGLDVPFGRADEFAAGYRSGLYRAHSEDASAIASCINTEIAALARDSEKLRAERLAKLGEESADAGPATE